MLEKSGFSGIWANVLRKVIVPLAECVPWCLAVNAPLCTLAVRLRSARLPPTATESSYRSPHVGTIFGILGCWWGWLMINKKDFHLQLLCWLQVKVFFLFKISVVLLNYYSKVRCPTSPSCPEIVNPPLSFIPAL